MSRFLLPFLCLPLLAIAGDSLPAPERLGLTAAVDWASSHNRDIQVARRAVEAAESSMEVAGGRPNPTLSLNASSINLGSGLGGGALRDKQVDSVLRLDQPFERGNKRELRLAQAGAALEAAQADLAEARRQQILAVRLAYWDLRLAADRVRLSREGADLMRSALAKNELRLKAGDIAPADLARIRVDALRAESDARAAITDLKRARVALAALLSQEALADRLQAADEWPVPVVPSAVSTSAIQERSDVRAASARLEAAAQGKALAESLRTRDVTVGVQFEHYPPDARHTVGLGVSIPLFTGYDYGGEIKRAWSDWGVAQEALERVKSGAVAQVDRLLEEAAGAADRARIYQESILPSARKSAAAVELAYTHGAAGVLDLLDARRTLRATEGDGAAALADYAKALASLEAARQTEAR